MFDTSPPDFYGLIWLTSFFPTHTIERSESLSYLHFEIVHMTCVPIKAIHNGYVPISSTWLNPAISRQATGLGLATIEPGKRRVHCKRLDLTEFHNEMTHSL